ncbi:MAG TPA: M24 family metallopeptidase [Thermoanaerobaculia bacterium]|nr:M24 family metallopeptidase [Thermoanaerobaculia bacterium]
MSSPDALDGRLAFLNAGLDELGCQALLVFAPSAADPDLAVFTGSVHLGESLLVAPRGERPRLAYLTPMERDEAAATGLLLITPEELDVLRWTQEAPEPVDFTAAVTARALELAGLSPGRVALAGHGRVGVLHAVLSRLARSGWSWVPANDLLTGLRKGKVAGELAAIRAAAAGTVEAFRTVARLLAAAGLRAGEGDELWLEGERLTVARLRAEVARTLAGFGLEQPRGNIIAPGEEGGVPHSTGTQERVLRAGESLVVDLFPRGTLFADCTRTFCVGTPPEPLARAHAAVLAALRAAHAGATAGATSTIRGWDLQEAVCHSLGDAGYPTPISHPGTTRGYVHNLGHGVGFELHEQPIFKKVAGREGVLAHGDVFTLEPGLYDPEAGYGVRLEDLVHLTPGGLENLTPLPYDLDPRAWG